MITVEPPLQALLCHLRKHQRPRLIERVHGAIGRAVAAPDPLPPIARQGAKSFEAV